MQAVRCAQTVCCALSRAARRPTKNATRASRCGAPGSRCRPQMQATAPLKAVNRLPLAGGVALLP